MEALTDSEMKLLFGLVNSKVFELEQVVDGALIGNLEESVQKENAKAMLVNLLPVKMKIAGAVVARGLE